MMRIAMAIGGAGGGGSKFDSAAAKRLKVNKGKATLALVKTSAIVLAADFADW